MGIPILKWAGGKRQLLPIIDENLPDEFKNGKIKKFAEPFIGGGAVYFHVAEKYDIEKAYISDNNIELVLLYKTIQNNVQELILHLEYLSEEYYKRDEKERQEYFYQIREKFNANLKTIDFTKIDTKSAQRVSQLIFLNKTCFNGLFRVNKKGYFNVPFGRYKKPKILDTANLNHASHLLQKATISHSCYSNLPEEFRENTLIYLDPPYRPLNLTSSFTAYSKYDFNDLHQEELSVFCKTLSKRTNLSFLLSNSDPKNTNENDDFFDILYKDFHIQRVKANRMINSNGSKRGKVTELLIKNY